MGGYRAIARLCALIAAAAVILAFPALSATIRGSVYGPDLEPINDIIVKINSKPAQQYLVKNASYEFDVPTGVYTLTADMIGNMSEEYHFSEKVEVLEDGRYIIDVILMPDLGQDLGDIPSFPDSMYTDDNGIVDMVSDATAENGQYTLVPVALIVLAVIIVAAAMIAVYIRKRGKHREELQEKDESYERILALMKKNRRMTQKDITREVYLSDAKVSLVLTQMESDGLIKKIRKGRTNVIIWSK